jgi:hypothetical protein
VDTRISDTQLTCKNENQTANSTKFERAKNTTINQINQIHSRLPSHSHQLHGVQLDIAPFPNVRTVMYGEQSESEELNSIQSININQYQSIQSTHTILHQVQLSVNDLDDIHVT